MAKVSVQQIIAKALWAEGNNRIGHRPWKQVGNIYMAEAGQVLAALSANGFTVVDKATWDDISKREAMRAPGRVRRGPT
jgi:hypothetical protein